LRLIRFCEYSIEASEYKQILKIKIMTFNNKTMQKVSSYETPSVTTLEVLSEGVLCGSYDWTVGGGGSYGDDDTNDNGDY
jgi:hypothetical protein